MMKHHMKLHQQPFEMIKSGRKRFELRLYDDKRREVKPGDVIEFLNPKTGEVLICSVKKLHIFASFKELYASLPLTECGYTDEDVKDASPADMNLYYTDEQQSAYGVVGIEIEVIA